MASLLRKLLFRDKSVTPGPPYTNAQFFNNLQDAVIDAGGSSDARPPTAHNHDTVYPNGNPSGATGGQVWTYDAVSGGWLPKTPAAGSGGAVTADTPIAGVGSATDHLRIPAATASAAGYMTAADKTKLNAEFTVGDFGAVPNDPTAATANRTAFQNALNSGASVGVPYGNWYIGGGLLIPDFVVLKGAGLFGNSDSEIANGSTKLIFTGNFPTTPCFAPSDLTTPLTHGGMSDMTVRASGSYSYIWDYKTVSGFKMSSIRAEPSSTTCGGFRASKINATDSSWVVNWYDVEIRLPDASTARPLDVDFSDGAVIGGSFTGGQGAILRGTGGFKLLGVRIDRSNQWGLTLSLETEARLQHIINGCQIEENAFGGILVNGDANDSIAQTWVGFLISNCVFRNPAAGAQDIRLLNATGPILRGGVIGPNSHATDTSNPVVRDPMRWTDVTVLPGGVNQGAGAPSAYAGGKFLQGALVLAQSGASASVGGTTAETTLATILVPGDVMLANGRLRITTLWNTSATANTKNLRVKFGGTIFSNVSVGSGQGAAQIVTEIQNRNDPAAQVALGATSLGSGDTTGGLSVGGVNTRTPLNIAIAAQLTVTTDAVNLQGYLVELIPAQ